MKKSKLKHKFELLKERFNELKSYVKKIVDSTNKDKVKNLIIEAQNIIDDIDSTNEEIYLEAKDYYGILCSKIQDFIGSAEEVFNENYSKKEFLKLYNGLDMSFLKDINKVVKGQFE